MMIGDLVLFRLDDHTLRPLLVTGVYAVETGAVELLPTVSGTLFLERDDRYTWWVIHQSKILPSEFNTGVIWIDRAAGGGEIGQWQERHERRREERQE